ncbi:hypothetical protein D3C86_1297860 [compost metagenome]
MQLNPYTIKHAISIDSNNVAETSTSLHAPNEKILLEKLKGKKGTWYIITDKQFGLIQNLWGNGNLNPNTKLSYHLSVTNKHGMKSLIPMTKKQFENPIIQ